jgi:hypothetical protein
MEALGRASGCYNNPGQAPGFEGEITYLGCKKFSSGWGVLNAYFRASNTLFGGQGTITEVLTFKQNPDDYGTYSEMTYLDRAGSRVTRVLNQDFYWQIDPTEGAVCGEQAPGPQFPDWQPDTPIGPTYTYYDSETDCTWQIKPYDVYLNSAGEPIFHWKATSDDPIKCGGPYEWWGNGQDPNIPNFPNPKQDDEPDPPPPIPPGPGTDIKEKLDDILERLEELEKCACPEKPELAKHWRSIRFESDEQTPRGNRRLSKLFRYRGVSAGVVDAVADHWKNFRWTTGPACVYHKGSPLGTPKVWAATPDEGKRVIRHAGREAGIDPDQIGEWGISGSDNPRYGVSLEVGLFCVDGCWSATSRSGPDGYPEAAVAVPDS